MTESTPPSEARRRPSTLGVHGGAEPGGPGDPVVPPIVQSATFLGSGLGEGELRYSRYGNNPNQLLLGRKIAALEGTEAGVALSSGMGAMAMTLLALTRGGDHVVASRHLYGATAQLLRDELPKRGVTTTFVDPGERRVWRSALRENTRVLLLELPTNPTLRVFDPRPLAKLAKEQGITTVVDATFASPVNLRPAELGIDVVVHSATKYLGGHSDLVAGLVAGPRPLVDEVTAMMKLYGPALDPHAAWLLDRGMRTLDVRVRRQNENALALAAWLARQPGVARVVHPGLEDHPDHALAREIMDGFGGMVSVVLEGGGDAADALLERLEVAMVAPSLGGVETLVSQPRHTSHRGMDADARAEVGIPDGFVRISVGVEDVDDLIEDFGRGLAGLR
jgi:cystathionine beta-lyase/cystathionine gamma-synthase